MSRFPIQTIVEMDQASMVAFSQWRRKPLTALLKIFSYSGNGAVWVTAGVILSLLEITKIQLIGMQRAVWRSMFCSLVAWGIGAVIKRSVERKRPFQRIKNFQPLVKTPVDDSFPSSHASSSTAFFVAMSVSHHPLAPYAGIWAVLVTFSRFYLGVHFPSDLAGGALLGACCGLVVRLL